MSKLARHSFGQDLLLMPSLRGCLPSPCLVWASQASLLPHEGARHLRCLCPPWCSRQSQLPWKLSCSVKGSCFHPVLAYSAGTASGGSCPPGGTEDTTRGRLYLPSFWDHVLVFFPSESGFYHYHNRVSEQKLTASQLLMPEV